MTLSEKLDSISDHRSSHDMVKEDAPDLFEEMQIAIGRMLVEVTCAPIESFTHSALILEKIFFGYGVNEPETLYSETEKKVIDMIFENYRERIRAVTDAN